MSTASWMLEWLIAGVIAIAPWLLIAAAVGVVVALWLGFNALRAWWTNKPVP